MRYLLCVGTFYGEGCVSYTLGLILMDFSFFLNMNRRIVIAVWTTALTDRWVDVSNVKVTLQYAACIVQFVLLGGQMLEAQVQPFQ
jgi:hypothetical protein